MNNDDTLATGFPEFSPILFQKFNAQIRLVMEHSQFANEVLAKLPPTMKKEQIVIYMLARMTLTGWVELLMLVGNGAGLGAMKIMRGMFESSVMAEYLRQNPKEVDDYLAFGYVIQFKRLKMFSNAVEAKVVRKTERLYNKVKSQFATKTGVRNQWNKHSIAYMAEKIGRKQQYEISYSIAASIHHGNFEAMIAHLSGGKEILEIEQPPSLEWIAQALMSAHICLLHALDTLNDCFALGFDQRLKEASETYAKVWATNPNP